MTRDALGLAALDPDAAARAPIDAVASRPAGPPRRVGDVELPHATPRPHALTLSATVKRVPHHSRWRFFVFWCLMKLACRVYPFNFEIYREEEPWEKED